MRYHLMKDNLEKFQETTPPDFYSFSSLRDLLFHVKEHHFNLLEIQLKSKI